MDCSFEKVDGGGKEEKVDEGGKETKMDSLQGAMEEMGENSVRLPILERVSGGSETGVDCGEIKMEKGRPAAGGRMGTEQIGGEEEANSSLTNRTPSRRRIMPLLKRKQQRKTKENKEEERW